MKKKDIHVGEEYWIPSSINNTIPSPRFERYEVLAYSPNKVSPAEKARFQQVLRRYESEGKREEGERWVKLKEREIIEHGAEGPWVVRSIWVNPAGEHERGIPKRKKSRQFKSYWLVVVGNQEASERLAEEKRAQRAAYEELQPRLYKKDSELLHALGKWNVHHGHVISLGPSSKPLPTERKMKLSSKTFEPFARAGEPVEPGMQFTLEFGEEGANLILLALEAYAEVHGQ
jgi:hypothetical protein